MSSGLLLLTFIAGAARHRGRRTRKPGCGFLANGVWPPGARRSGVSMQYFLLHSALACQGGDACTFLPFVRIEKWQERRICPCENSLEAFLIRVHLMTPGYWLLASWPARSAPRFPRFRASWREAFLDLTPGHQCHACLPSPALSWTLVAFGTQQTSDRNSGKPPTFCFDYPESANASRLLTTLCVDGSRYKAHDYCHSVDGQ